MLKFFRAVRTEQSKLWGKRSAFRCLVLAAALSLLVTFIASGLHFRRYALPCEPINEIMRLVTDYGMTEAPDDPEEYYTGVANDAAEKLISVNADVELAQGTSRYSLEKERTELLREGGIAKYRVKYGIYDEEPLAGCVVIFCLWLLTPIVTAVAVTFASDMFAGEFVRGTIRMTLCRPVTRIRQYLAKHFVVLLYVGLLLGVGYAASMITAMIKCGGGMTADYVGYMSGTVYRTGWLQHTLAALACSAAMVISSVAMCACVGNTTHSRTASVIVPVALSLGAQLCGAWIGAAGSSLVGLTYFCSYDLLAPLCGLADSAALGFTECAASLGMHTIVMLIIGYVAFRRDVE